MTVRCKLKLVSLTDAEETGTPVATFETVYDDTIPEDVSFNKYTPYGKVELAVCNPRALEKLVVGADYYVDFNKITEG